MQLYDSMMAREFLTHAGDALMLTDTGAGFVASLGLDLSSLPSPRAPMCRDCLDWSERCAHLAGRLGRGLFSHMEQLGWPAREQDSRVVAFCPSGRIAFDAAFPPG